MNVEMPTNLGPSEGEHVDGEDGDHGDGDHVEAAHHSGR